MTRLRERFYRLLFNRCVTGVLATPPLDRGDRSFIALSMVHRRDLSAYLLAIKSFASFARPERVVVVADPSMTLADRRLLATHVPHVEIVDARDARHPELPVGGTWERLATIARFNPVDYVVQLDADTLTTGMPTAVIDAVNARQTFLLRSESGVEIQALERAAETGRRLRASSGHIQVETEARLAELPSPGEWRYARACSGFAGFAPGAIDLPRLCAVSSAMRSLHGDRWDEWGTEQVTSNLFCASAPRARMLPHPDYCNADSRTDQTLVTHYIGYARFTSRAYESDARSVIDELSRRGSALAASLG